MPSIHLSLSVSLDSDSAPNNNIVDNLVGGVYGTRTVSGDSVVPAFFNQSSLLAIILSRLVS